MSETSRRALLRRLVAPEPRPPRARIRLDACLAWSGSFCSICMERCPVQGAVLLVGGKPVIDPQACDGCGICASVCPSPWPAITLEAS